MIDEQELLSRVQCGDSGALEQLLFAHHDRLLRSIGRSMLPVVRDLAAAEDVLQETFIRAYRHIASFSPDGEDSFYRWLSTIANNHIRDLIRAQGAAKRGGGRPALKEADMSAIDTNHAGLLSQLAIDSRTPSREAAGHEALTALQIAMASLKSEYRQAFTLRYIEEHSVAVTAKSMGKTERAVQMLCHRGLKRLHEAMGQASQFLTWKT